MSSANWRQPLALRRSRRYLIKLHLSLEIHLIKLSYAHLHRSKHNDRQSAPRSSSLDQGLHKYLAAHTYANTVTTDLWAALEESSGKPVSRMMHAWTGEMGYPLVTVLPPAEGKKGLRLRQNRFLSKGPPTAEEDQVLWWIPVRAAAGGVAGAEVKQLETFVLAEREGEAEAFQVAEGDGAWLRLNAGQTGIFRVNYTPELWKGLSAAVVSLQLPVIDRLGELMVRAASCS